MVFLTVIFHPGVHFRVVVLHVYHLLHKIFIRTQHKPVAFTGKSDQMSATDQPVESALGDDRVGEEGIPVFRCPVGRYYQ